MDNGQIWLDTNDEFIREPFYASFKIGQFDFTLIAIHVIFGDSIGDRREEKHKPWIREKLARILIDMAGGTTCCRAWEIR